MQVPNHVAVIIDGNRRWAASRHKLPWAGHKKGAETLDNFFNWCYELDVPQVSAWVMSTENFGQRSPKEITELLKIFEEYLEKLLAKKSDFLDKYQVRVRFIGDLEKLPPRLVRLMGKIMIKTAKYQKKMLNILINYGGYYDMTQAIKKIVQKIIKVGRIEITPKDIEKNLLLPVPIDLVIRTGGRSRLSNFALWQAAYAEIYVTKTLWPDFSKKELIKAIKWYNSAERNFGK
jgi:undecaprenyl diphosphate synthase